MTASRNDNELVSDFVAQGSESAFRALVTRHVDLVYGTAMRLLGDADLAQEVTQNVFVALARKAPRLGGIETLGGWLHRTTVFEARARVRSELRRRRRETIAAERIVIERQGESTLDEVLPLLDEALLNLRERDRAALVLRYLENRSLREVGEKMGIGEDTARKRVDRALERLTVFFRKRGIPVGTAGGVAAWLSGSAQAAPAAVAAGAIQAGLSQAGSVTALSTLLFKVMALTTTQTAVVCGLVVTLPLGWQVNSEARLSRQLSAVTSRAAQTTSDVAALESAIADARYELVQIETDIANTEQQFALSEERRAGRLPAPQYSWNDSRSLLRIPKQQLRNVTGMQNKRGVLSDEIKEVLQMTPAEAASVQSAVDQFVEEYHAIRARGVERVEPTETDRQWTSGAEVRVFQMEDISEQFHALRKSLIDRVEMAIGPERAELFRNSLRYWMPIDERDIGLGSTMAATGEAHRVRFSPDGIGTGRLNSGWNLPNGSGFSAPIELDEIPEYLRVHLEDWIRNAQPEDVKEINR